MTASVRDFRSQQCMRLKTWMLIDDRRLRVGMTQGAYDEGQIARSPPDLRRKRVASTVENNLFR